MLNLNVMGLMSGSDKKVAGAGADMFKNVPGIKVVKIGGTTELAGYVDGTAKVNYLYNNGTMGDAVPVGSYELNAETKVFKFTGETPETAIDRVIVRYDRDATAGVGILNRADKFPNTMHVILKVLIVDPCDWGYSHSRHVQQCA